MDYLYKVRSRSPLIHCITNYVTVNDVANILLACGARPMMADEPLEMDELESIADGLVLNIGTLNERKAAAMLIAGRRANELGHACVLDPVGVGASRFRMDSVRTLMNSVKFDVIKGNFSEIKTLFTGEEACGGVDADAGDTLSDENCEAETALLKSFALKSGAVIVATGATDIVCDASRAYLIRNGHAMMRSVTGTGCQMTALLCAFVASNPRAELESAACAVALMGVAGGIAYRRLATGEGNSAYRGKIIDAVFNMTDEILAGEADYEIR